LEYDWVSLKSKDTPARYRSMYEEESKRSRIDQLNKLYVAHTRAGKELHIITEKRKPKGGGNYSKVLAEFCELYGISEREKGRNEEKEKENLIFTLFKQQNNLSREAPRTAYCVPHTVGQQRGIYIHNFLSSLIAFPQNEKEIETVVKKAEEKYREDMTHIFHKILHDSLLQPYFAPDVKVLNETSILFPNGNLLRPDRVVFLEGRVVVIDYKTGEPTASHKEQIDQYCEAIREMGYNEVEGVVLYI
jgi:ATP-dependent exoDNAse (exonuclease V) beta subunit